MNPQQQNYKRSTSSSDTTTSDTDFVIYILRCVFKFLPSNPNFCTNYIDIQQEEYFQSCRKSILYYALTHDINPMIDNIEGTLLKILCKFNEFPKFSTSKRSSFPIKSNGICNYLLIFLKLLCDICEVNWVYNNNNNKDIPIAEKKIHLDRDAYFYLNTGDNIDKAHYHNKEPPIPLKPHIANSLISFLVLIKSIDKVQFTIDRIKYCDKLSFVNPSANQSNLDTSESTDNLNLNSNVSTDLRDQIDIYCEYLLRYVAASNPVEYKKFLSENVIIPILDCKEINVAPTTGIPLSLIYNLEYLSFYFVTNKNIAIFLRLVNRLLSSFKRQICKKILLLFVSHSLKMWILTRAEQYVEIVNLINSHNNGEDGSNHNVFGTDTSTSGSGHGSHNEDNHDKYLPTGSQLKKEISNIFSLVFNSFNISSLLTEKEKITSVFPLETLSSPSEIIANSASTLRNNININNNTPLHMSNTSTSTISNSNVRNVASSTPVNKDVDITNTLNKTGSNNNTYLNSPSTDIETPVPSISSASLLSASIDNNSNNTYFIRKQSPSLGSTPAKPSRNTPPPVSYASTQFYASSSSSSSSAIPSVTNTTNHQLFDSLDKYFESSNADSLMLSSSNFGFVPLYDPLENPGDIGILRMLIVLSSLDVECLKDINSSNYKGLPDFAIALTPVSSPTYSSSSSSSLIATTAAYSPEVSSTNNNNAILGANTSSPPPLPQASTVGNGHHLHQPTVSKLQNLKKITTNLIPGTNSKEVKFWNLLLKIFSNGHAVPDGSLLYILKSLLFCVELGAAVATVDRNAQIVLLSKRFFEMYYYLLDFVHYENNTSANSYFLKYYKHLKDVAEKNPVSIAKMKIEFVFSACLLEPDDFSVVLKEALANIVRNITSLPHVKNLECYMDGLRIFFKLPFPTSAKVSIFRALVRPLKGLSYTLSTNLLNSLPFFCANVSDVVDDILEGKYKVDALDSSNRLDCYFGNPLTRTNNIFRGDNDYMKALEEELSSSYSSSNAKKKTQKKGTSTMITQSKLPLERELQASYNSILCNISDIMKRAIISFGELTFPPGKALNYKFVLKHVFVGLVSNNDKLTRETISCCMLSITYFKLDASTPMFSTMYTLISYIIVTLSFAVFNLELPVEIRTLLLNLIHMCLEVRATMNENLYQYNKFSTLDEEDREIFKLIYSSLGRSLLVSLCLHDVKSHSLLRQTFESFKKELSYCLKAFNLTWDNLPPCNYSFVEAVCNSNYISTGPIAFQRHIRADILKCVKEPNKMLFDAVEIVFDRWFQMSTLGLENLPNQELNNYRNYAGLLATTFGVFNFYNEDYRHGLMYLKKYKSIILQKSNFFIEKQCGWLNSSDLLTRENSKDLLGIELNPNCFGMLFKHLNSELEKITGNINTNNDVISSTDFTFLEQITSVMRSIMERDDIEVIILSTKIIFDIIDKILGIIQMLKADMVSYYKSIIYVSKLFVSMRHAEKFLCVTGDHLLKNQWIKFVLTWFEEAVFKNMDYENLSKSHREMDLVKRDNDYLYLDTSIDCAKALSYLTTNVILEVSQAVNEEELKRSKSVIFGNYFNIFLRALEKNADYESIPFVLRHKITLLNENIISCLTNLLNANSDVGLDNAIPIGYSSNKTMRITFLKLFTEITRNYGDRKSHSGTLQKSNAEKLLRGFIEYPQCICLISHCCPVNDIESLASSLVNLFQSKNLTHVVIAQLIEDEITRSNRYMDVLRRNSAATRSLAMFSRLKGADYLKSTIKPILDEIILRNENFEVEKAASNEESEELNLKLLEKYMSMLTGHICLSINIIPPEFIYIAQKIRASVQKKFPGYELVAVGSFLFLRFFCPALVSPDSENLITQMNSENRRCFLMLAKIVQNIANQSLSAIKWPMIQKRMDFLKKCSEKIFNFLDQVSDLNLKVSIRVNPDAPMTNFDIDTFHKILYYNRLRIREMMIKDIKSNEDLRESIKFIKFIDSSLVALGQPRLDFKNEIPKYVRDRIDTYPQLYEFMSRHSLKSHVINERLLFVHEAAGSDGMPVFVLTLKYLLDESWDVEKVVYRMIQVSCKVWTRKYAYLVDGTGYHSNLNERLNKIFTLFNNLLTKDAYQNCFEIYYYNINSDFMKFWVPFLKNLFNSSFFELEIQKQLFLNSDCSPSTVKKLGLSDYSKEVYNDVRVTLHNTSFYERKKGRFVPITLKIGNKHFQIIKETPTRLKFRDADEVYEFYETDVYEVSDVVSAAMSSTTGVPFEFRVFLSQSEPLVMSTQKHFEILKIFYYTQAKLDEDYRNGTADDNYLISNRQPEDKAIELDLLSRLILVMQAGLSSDDDEVKGIAYNLLAALQSSFNFNLGEKFSQVEEIYLPEDNSRFCEMILESLSISKPSLTFYLWKHILEDISTVLSDSQILSCIHSLAPWVKNISTYVYEIDDEHGPENAASLIRLLIKVTVSKPKFFQTFKYFIWAELVLDNNLLPLVIDEIVSHAIDRESEGVEWKDATSIVTRTSTTEIGGLVIKRIMKIIKSILSNPNLNNSINNWSELYILIHIIQEISFNSILSAEMFLPELLYIVCMLVDLGPSKLRIASHRLFINVCNSFLMNDALELSKLKKLKKIIELLSNQKTKFMFGFNQERNSYISSFNASTFLAKFRSLEQLTEYVMALLHECNSNKQNCIQWQGRFNKYILDTVFNYGSFLSARSLIILSLLSRNGLSDDLLKSVLIESMKVIGCPELTDELMFCILSHVFSYSNFVYGIKDNTVLLAQVTWLSTTFTISTNITLFHGAIVSVRESLKRISNIIDNEKESPLSILFAVRAGEFGRILNNIEKLVGITCTIDNFLIFITYYSTKGLLVSHTKATSLEGLKAYVDIFIKNKYHKTRKDYAIYLYLLWLCSSDKDFDQFCEERDLKFNKVLLDDQVTIPDVLSKWIITNDQLKNITLYQSSIYVSSSSVDESVKMKAFCISEYLIKKNPHVFFKYMNNIISESRNTASQGVVFNLVRKAFDISNISILHSEYRNIMRYNIELKTLLEKWSIPSIVNIHFSSTSRSVTSGLKGNDELIYNRKKYTVELIDAILKT
ncbi:uncharacterized protein SCODWIG_01065 [Saccharomycodes ludwigii]|uniref:Ras-GAP domain-containing protein n=1 Tax=Saccharomycodes ludwigii TaxID=36035 RepID=A0A376B489_9ASCO|nr:hypothetical protein SCDLUD_002515 [Saccharomycodes ludwigii]KAH3901041.1 hypothetical protein SCDLUD_002515 [Saccharomycodes ludwigii]SSD59304.1 uncharacterized protein SCODWIG_01065 [Saccharomycodes ludwigii]